MAIQVCTRRVNYTVNDLIQVSITVVHAFIVVCGRAEKPPVLPFFQIDNAAHIGGLAAGFGIGYVAGLPRVSGGAEQFWKVVAIVCIILTALSFLEMYLWFSQPQ